DGEVVDGHGDETGDAEHCRVARAALAPACIGAEQEIAYVDEPQYQCGRQARIPLPPSAKDGARPDGAGDQHQGGEDSADLGAGTRHPVPALVAAPEVDNAGKEDDEEG